ncbi:uncharacterized protein BO96DRAFT_439687 [Aspergillus niger CBS 101883]|uniref:uncharacterized protein n=1 Tax=Aspergillus lacticoffeatus (strain CBS 101883) TaxID=1450533 RepID=UPI000D7FCC2F|nr:uncharacterized protein BO96DRAFT_439687 [Aspergillus niger CBS 101883]PYH50711.1 hypothetical protein BO96DRAFT_439687 [Aspergillus niger CBS 101883]
MAAESCLLGLRAYEFPASGSLFAAVYAFTRHPHNEMDRTLALVVGYSSCLAKSLPICMGNEVSCNRCIHGYAKQGWHRRKEEELPSEDTINAVISAAATPMMAAAFVGVAFGANHAREQCHVWSQHRASREERELSRRVIHGGVYYKREAPLGRFHDDESKLAGACSWVAEESRLVYFLDAMTSTRRAQNDAPHYPQWEDRNVPALVSRWGRTIKGSRIPLRI